MTITLDANISVPEAVYTQEVDDETILLDVESGKYFGLDPVGTRMWQLLRQHGALRTVYDTMLAEYEVDPERLETDLIVLTEKMIEKGLAELKKDTERGLNHHAPQTAQRLATFPLRLAPVFSGLVLAVDF